MTKLVLQYFDNEGGPGQSVRLALETAGIPYEDRRIRTAAWSELKPSTPYGALPVLFVGGASLAQTNAILRFVGKQSGLYPADLWQAALCDEAMDSVEELGAKITQSFGMTGEALRQARATLVAEILPSPLRQLDARLAERGEWFADGRPTIADLAVFMWVRLLKSGQLDHVPTDLVDRLAPNLAAHMARVSALPAVRDHYARREAARAAA